jgi:hypothetical protein
MQQPHNKPAASRVQESRAHALTISIGGSWFDDHGVARCPVCGRTNLTVTDGDRAVRFYCASGCNRGAVVQCFTMRGLMRPSSGGCAHG